MKHYGIEFSDVQTPIKFDLDQFRYGETEEELRLNITLASEEHGIIKVPIALNFSNAKALASLLLGAAHALKPKINDAPTGHEGGTDEN